MGSVAGAAADAVAARIGGAPPRPRTPASTSSRADRDPIPTDSTSEANATMEQPLWAPWRMEFIRSAADGLHLLRLPGSAGDEGSREPRRAPGAQAFTCTNRYPYNSAT